MSAVLTDWPTEGVLRITLNRPDRLNAFDASMLDLLRDAFAKAAAPACRAVVLAASGRAFCAGVDLKDNGMGRYVDGRDPVEGRAEWGEFATGVFQAIRRCSVPVVAAVNGIATGGGLSLSLIADVRIGGESARFRNGYIRNGISGCELGTSYTLPRLVGVGRAMELMMTGREVDAVEAERMGLLNRVVPDDELADAAVDFAQQMSQHAAFATTMTKQVAYLNVDATGFDAAVALEMRTQLLALQTDDCREARDSLRERREPAYTGFRGI